MLGIRDVPRERDSVLGRVVLDEEDLALAREQGNIPEAHAVHGQTGQLIGQQT